VINSSAVKTWKGECQRPLAGQTSHLRGVCVCVCMYVYCLLELNMHPTLCRAPGTNSGRRAKPPKTLWAPASKIRCHRLWSLPPREIDPPHMPDPFFLSSLCASMGGQRARHPPPARARRRGFPPLYFTPRQYQH